MKHILAYGADLRSALQDTLKAQMDHTTTGIPWGRDFYERLAPFTAAGKQLRGSLVCFAYEMFSGEPPDQAVVKLALAVELAHSAILIHDDIMDNDEMRRGQPSLHTQYQQLADSQAFSHGQQFGINMAMCGGDAALFAAFALLADVQAKANLAIKASQLFVKQLLQVCAGQMQDVYLDASPALPTKPAIYQLMKTKTAAYTVSMPLSLGAILAGQSAQTLRQLKAIGEPTGVIYQIRDDELGLMGSFASLGKPVGSDVREGKKTLLYYHLMKHCNAADLRRLRADYGNPDVQPDDIAYVQALYQRYQIDQLLSKEVNRLTKRACCSIDTLAVAESWRADLRDLVTFCAQRQI